MNIIKALTHYMGMTGMSSAELHRQSGVNLATISLVLNGHRGASIATMEQWADCFHL